MSHQKQVHWHNNNNKKWLIHFIILQYKQTTKPHFHQQFVYYRYPIIRFLKMKGKGAETKENVVLNYKFP